MAWNNNIRNLLDAKMVRVVANISMCDVDPIGESSFYGITLVDPTNLNQHFTIFLDDIVDAWKKRNPDLDSASFEEWMGETLGEIIGNAPKAPIAKRYYDAYEMEV